MPRAMPHPMPNKVAQVDHVRKTSWTHAWVVSTLRCLCHVGLGVAWPKSMPTNVMLNNRTWPPSRLSSSSSADPNQCWLRSCLPRVCYIDMSIACSKYEPSWFASSFPPQALYGNSRPWGRARDGNSEAQAKIVSARPVLCWHTPSMDKI